MFIGLDENYVIDNSVLVENVKTMAEVDVLLIGSKAQSVQYFDGIGRPKQNVSTQGSPLKNDIIQPIQYDQFGREPVKYLPFVEGNNGRFKSSFISRENGTYATPSSPQYQFYQSTPSVASDSKPYSETIFEPSPLNRILKQSAPGDAWKPNTDIYSMVDNTVKKRYEFNTTAEVFLFKYDAVGGLVSLDPDAAKKYYAPNQLYANKTYDEHNNDVIEYTDKEGRTVCKKVKASATEYASTYYIFDDFGNLVVVLPPEGVKALTN